jgi:hypothetical protein
MDSTTELLPHDINGLPKSPRGCETRSDLRNQQQRSQNVNRKRFQSVFIVARQAGLARRASSASFSRSGFTDALRRLRRESKVAHENVMSCPCVHEARFAAPTIPDDDNVYRKASKAVGGLVSMRRQPSTPGSGGRHAPDRRSVRVHDINSNAKHDSQCTEEVQINGVVGTASSRCFETDVAPCHCAPTPDPDSKQRSTYSISGGHASRGNVSTNNFAMCDTMAVEMAPNMVDLQSELEWLAPIANFNRNFEMRDARNTQDEVSDNLQESSTIVQAPVQGHITTDIDDACDQNVTGPQEVESPPELDAGYQTSDSGLSVTDELTTEHLTPAQSMLELLSANVDGRFGSFYSVSNHSLIPEPHIQEMDFAYSRPEMCESRFSWGSSVYSNDMDFADDNDTWWKPKPLVVNKDPQAPPPIPQRNPLRLLRRLSSGPKGSGESVRASKNIHNLQLDLSRLRKEDSRSSLRDLKFSRRRSHVLGSRHKPQQTGNETEPQLALPGHILDAMQSSAQQSEAAAKHVDKKKTRRSPKSNITSTAHSRSQSTKEIISGSTYAQQLMKARGHTRAASDPIRQASTREGTSYKWNEVMPADEPIRRTCISSLTNEHKPRKPAAALAINKQLPPLPWMVEMSQGKVEV